MTPAYFQKKYEALERAKAYNAELRKRRRERAIERKKKYSSLKNKERYQQSKLEVLRNGSNKERMPSYGN